MPSRAEHSIAKVRFGEKQFWFCHSVVVLHPVPSWMDLHCTACHVSLSKSSTQYSSILEGGAAGQVLARDRAIKLVVLLTFKQLLLVAPY